MSLNIPKKLQLIKIIVLADPNKKKQISKLEKVYKELKQITPPPD